MAGLVVIAIAVAAVGCLVLALTSSGNPLARAAAPASVWRHEAPLPAPASHAQTLAACEQAVEHAHAPSLVVVGASFTAGVGPGTPDRSWAVVLARTLRWNAVVYGVAGAGYVRPGVSRQGPVAVEIGRLDLRSLDPALVIVQAGHDDIGVPARLERQRVAQVVALIHAEAPTARIALLTVFAGRSPAAAATRTDRAIVVAARAADRDVIVMDPLTAGWRYQRSPDGLHPTAAGSQWLAGKVAGILRQHGVLARASALSPVMCDYSRAYPAGRHSRISVPPSVAVSAKILPPWLSATWRTMARPRPEPGTARADGAR